MSMLLMELGDEVLSLETVIVVACVCGSVVFVLTVVLIVLCCRRHHTKYYYEKADTNIGRQVLVAATCQTPRVNCQSSCKMNVSSSSSTPKHLAPASSASHLNNTTSLTENKAICDADADDKKTSDVNGGTMTSEYRPHRKVIYEVIV